MKKSLTIIAMLLVAVVAQADPIDASQAQALAQKALKGLGRTGAALEQVAVSAETKARFGSADAQAPAFYLFNASDNAEANDGFVIVSGDDQLPAILGYSAEGHLAADLSDCPPALSAWLESVSKFVAAVQAREVEAPVRKAESTGTVIVEPLVSSKWGQDSPYNLQCPSDGSARAVTGCVATAMAQTMYKWKWPETGRGSESYRAEGYGTQTVRFYESEYDWSSMKDTYSLLDGRKASGKAVAKLMYDCGVATQMEYSAGGSGTTEEWAYIAMAKHFRYKCSTLDLIWRDCSNSQEEFDNVLKTELKAGRPIVFAASSSKGSGSDAAGHCYVVDGYDSNDYVHINWGWDGKYDGYFAINVMDGSDYQFDQSQRALIGIQPDYAGTDTIINPYRPVMFAGPTTDYTSVGMNDKFTVKVDTFANYWPAAFKAQVGIVLCDLNGNVLENASTDTQTYTLRSLTYFYLDGSTTCKLSGNYAAGDYVLRVALKNYGYDEWTLPDTWGGSMQNWLPVYIHGGKLHFNDVSTGISQVQGSREVVETKLFDLSGRQIVAPQKGQVFLQRSTYSDGTAETVKRVK